MSTIVKCRQCGQQVSIPSGMAFDAVVRCPLCKTEYPLRVLLMGEVSAPPALEAVSTSAPAPVVSPSVLDLVPTPAQGAEPALSAGATEAQTATAAPGEASVPAQAAAPAEQSAQAEVVVPQVGSAVSEQPAAGEAPVVQEGPPVAQESVHQEEEIGFAPAAAPSGPESFVPETVVAEVVAEPSQQPAPPEPSVQAALAAQEGGPTPDESAGTYRLAGDPDPALSATAEHGFCAEAHNGHDGHQWGAPSDGAAMTGALADLWQAAGVAPPIDAPEAVQARPEAVDHAPIPAAYEFTGTATDTSGVPRGPAQSFAAQAQKAETPNSRKVVRLVGVIVAGLLGLLVAWGLFTLVQSVGGCRKNSSSAKPPAAKTAPSPKTNIVPDAKEKERWKGLESKV